MQQKVGTRISPRQSRASLLQPEHVTIVWRRGSQWQVLPRLDRRFSARVEPAFDLRMAVRKRDAAGAVVIARGYVNQPKAAWIPRVEPSHVHDEKTVVDSVLAFIGDHPDACGTRKSHVGDFPHD